MEAIHSRSGRRLRRWDKWPLAIGKLTLVTSRGLTIDEPIEVGTDNDLCNHFTSPQHSRRIDRKLTQARELRCFGLVDVKYVPTSEKTADMMGVPQGTRGAPASSHVPRASDIGQLSTRTASFWTEANEWCGAAAT